MSACAAAGPPCRPHRRGRGARPTLHLHGRCFERTVQLIDDHRAWAAQAGGYAGRDDLPRWRLEERTTLETARAPARAVARREREWELERAQRDRRLPARLSASR